MKPLFFRRVFATPFRGFSQSIRDGSRGCFGFDALLSTAAVDMTGSWKTKKEKRGRNNWRHRGKEFPFTVAVVQPLRSDSEFNLDVAEVGHVGYFLKNSKLKTIQNAIAYDIMTLFIAKI